jgi:hypothetical protein
VTAGAGRWQRSNADEKWAQRRRAEQRQREDGDTQRQVVVEFLAGGPAKRPQEGVTTGDGITHRIVVTAPAPYPLKQVDVQIAHHSNAASGSSSLAVPSDGP